MLPMLYVPYGNVMVPGRKILCQIVVRRMDQEYRVRNK